MSQPPYPPPGNYSNPVYVRTQRNTNGLALASLICGILGCIPLLQLVAIILGILGIKNAKYSNSGKGLSIAGIILGVLFTLGWVGCGGTLGLVWVKSAPVRAASTQFLNDAGAGHTASALSDCTSDVSKEQIEALAADLSAIGPIQAVRNVSFFAQTDNTQGSRWTVQSIVVSKSGQTKVINLVLVNVSGQYKVRSFEYPGQSSFTAGPASRAPAPPDQNP